MSSINLQVEMLFADEAAASSAEAAWSAWSDPDAGIDYIESGGRLLAFGIDGSTGRFDPASVIEQITGSDAKTIAIRIINDQVGEETEIGKHNGRKCSYASARRHIDGGAPLEAAVEALEEENTSRFLRILKAGLDPNSRFYDRSLLSYVCEFASVEAVDAMLEAGADINALDDEDGATPLIVACRENAPTTVIERLLQAGAEIETADREGMRALHHGADMPAMVQALLAAGAEPNVSCFYGSTPLMVAATIHEPDSVRQLLEAGADPDAVSNDGGSVLFYAGGDPESRALIEKQATVFSRPVMFEHAVDTHALEQAVRFGDWEGLAEMLETAAIEDKQKLIESLNFDYRHGLFEAILPMNFDDCIETLLHKLDADLMRCDHASKYENNRRYYAMLRERWPERMREIDAECEAALSAFSGKFWKPNMDRKKLIPIWQDDGRVSLFAFPLEGSWLNYSVVGTYVRDGDRWVQEAKPD